MAAPKLVLTSSFTLGSLAAFPDDSKTHSLRKEESMQKLAYLGAVMLVLLGITVGAFHLDAQAKSAADDKAAIQALYNHFNDAFNKKDVNGIMAVYGPDLFVFDVTPPREYPSWEAYKKDWEVGRRSGRLRAQHRRRHVHCQGWFQDTPGCARHGCAAQVEREVAHRSGAQFCAGRSRHWQGRSALQAVTCSRPNPHNRQGYSE
jgi:hypothetical protein